MSVRRFVAGVAGALAIVVGASDAQAQGRWSGPVSLPLVPSSGAVLKNGKVLLWAADGEFAFGVAGRAFAVVYDPVTGEVSRRSATAGHNMFCTGTTLLADGRLLVNGGSNAPVTSIYDPAADTFVRAEDMRIPRGYNANTILADGSVFTLGGSWSGNGGQAKDAEVWTPGRGWRLLPGAPVQSMEAAGLADFGRDSHFTLFTAGNGRVLYAGPGPMMKWIDPTGSGRVTDAGRRSDDVFASSSNVVMYDAGKLLKTGGSARYSGAAASRASYAIDVSKGGAVVDKLAPMTYPRVYHNSVVLPDGRVVIVGGQTFGQGFVDNDSVLATEVWDPRTGQFTLAPSISVPRNYHSIALLLPDGRVLSGGGGLCGSCSTNHPDFQLYEPSYLFDASGRPASRPVIQASPDALALGRTADVTTDREVAAFSLVRMGSTTHTVNSDQRRLSVAFSRLGGTSYRLQVTSNAGDLPPGYWMLFALDAAGAPSVAKIVRVDPSPVATLVSPDPIAARIGEFMTAAPTVVAPASGVRFSAVNLPAGLSIDPATGAISGSPTEAGAALVSIVASANGSTVSTDVPITVDIPFVMGDGLLGEYYAGAGLAGPVVASRREALDFSVTSSGPVAGVPAVFSGRWRGSLRPSRGGATRLRVEADDGVRVWIGGKLIADDWTAHAAIAYEGQVDLVAGADHPVMIEYFNSGGPGVLRLSWMRPGDTGFSVIPAGEFFSTKPSSTANVALGRPASMSSTFEGAAASRAVDGDVNGVYSAGSVAHSGLETRPWWQVDLGGAASIDFARIWKRTDCCADRAQNLTVFVSGADMAGRSYDQLLADPSVMTRSYGASVITDFIDVPVMGRGRFVRVQAGSQTYLNIAEAQVFGAANGGPSIATPAPQSGRLNVAASLTLSATDPEGETLVFSTTGLPPGLSLDAARGVISGAPSAAGVYAPTVSAADPSGQRASASFSWTVTSAEPKVVRLDAPPVQAGSSATYAPVISDGEGASFAWRFGDGSTNGAFVGSAAASHVFTRPGVYSVTLLIRSSIGQTSSYGFSQAVYPAGAQTAGGVSTGGTAHQPTGTGLGRLWAVNRDNDSVAVLDLQERKLVAEIPVGSKPSSLVIKGDQVWVANRGDATISVVDATSLALVRTIALPPASRPSDLALVGPSADVAVTYEALGQIALLGPNGENYGSVDVGPNPRRMAISANRDKAYVSRFITPPLPGESNGAPRAVSKSGAPVGGEIRVINLTGAIERTIVLQASNAVDTEVSGRGIPNYLGAMAISPDGRSGWVPSKQDNVFRGTFRDGQNLNFQNTVRAIVSRVDLQTGEEDLASRIDVDNAGLASAVAIHPTGAFLFVALETSRAVAVLDPARRQELFRVAVGQAPNALTLLPGGRWLAVSNMMDRTVGLIDLQPLLQFGSKDVTQVATIPTITTEKLSPTVLRGKQLFYDAADTRLARDGYVSCASCHDDGEQDGRVWDLTGFGEGLRNTITLVGHGGRKQGLLHWSANFDEIQDFEGQIRSLAGGTGLMPDATFFSNSRQLPLGGRKTGLSADLDALAAYVTSLDIAPTSPWAPAGGGLSPEAKAGEAAFQRLGCATCHKGAEMTNSNNAGTLRDVGTLKRSSGQRLGGPLTGIDTPTLRGVWATAPYLHNGSAPTIEKAIRAHSKSTVDGAKADLDALVAYVRELGPAPR